MPLPEAEFLFSTTHAVEGTWSVVHARVQEAMSELFEATIVLAAPLGESSPDNWLGEASVFEIRRGHISRNFQGIVRRVEDLGSTTTHRLIRVVLVPALWILTQRFDSRIYQDATVAGVLRDVLRVSGLYQGENKLEIAASLERVPHREYLAQYRESDLAFVMRLLQDEGIPFYFRHEHDMGEQLVLCG